MLFWLREIAGWVLVVAALVMFFLAARFAMSQGDPQIIQAGLMVFAGTSVLRAGILLVRVSTAARVVDKADRTSTVANES